MRLANNPRVNNNKKSEKNTNFFPIPIRILYQSVSYTNPYLIRLANNPRVFNKKLRAQLLSRAILMRAKLLSRAILIRIL